MIDKKGLDMETVNKMILNMKSMSTSVQVCTAIFIILAMYAIFRIFGIKMTDISESFRKAVGDTIGKFISKRERSYSRKVDIGKIEEKSTTAKLYRFLNDLIIDLGYKRRGATPYGFLFIVIVFSAIVSLLTSRILFGGITLGVVTFPIVVVFIMCVLYTKACLEHDYRIDAIMKAENIISNGISNGVLPAIRDNLNLIDANIRGAYQDFVDDVEIRNVHITGALDNLRNNLGSISATFIRRCKVFEMEEEHGVVGMFRDIVEINNIKMRLRTKMKRQFEDITVEFIVAATMIIAFMVGILSVYPILREFYFRRLIGQILLAIDMLLFVIEFVYITCLRATDL